MIQALYIYDQHNSLLLEHDYSGSSPSSSLVLSHYLQHSSPRPSLIHASAFSPPCLLYNIIQDNLLFISPSTIDIEPLIVLEFLHRVSDALSEFVGSPLLATKITANYDVVSQVVVEMADGGVMSQAEPNALRDVVETGPGVLNNLLGKVGLPGSSPGLGAGPAPGPLQRSMQPALSSQGSAIPWRRSNVRHTSNELYVDIVESLSVTFAPSGRPLAGFAHGSIAFTSKVSGVPDLLLTLSTGGKGAGIGSRGDQLRKVMERAVFHPSVRLGRWSSDGVLSFIPPDGRFALCGYEVDLLDPDAPLTTGKGGADNLNLPARVELNTGHGSSGNEFEVRLTLPSLSSSSTQSAAAASLHSNLSSRPTSFRTGSIGDSKAPTIEELSVRVPIAAAVRNITDLRPTKGEAHWNPADGSVEWKFVSKDLVSSGATLRCTLQGPIAEEDEGAGNGILNGMTATTYDYDDDAPSAYQSTSTKGESINGNAIGDTADKTVERNRELMPTTALLSFSVKGWLVSGLRVESLLVDGKKSRGLGPEIKPYKGVKYLTVSRDGIEVRC